jgi:hypothetical protein
MLKRGYYQTRDGHRAKITRLSNNFCVATVIGVGYVAYDGTGNVAYDHIPAVLSLDINTWQPLQMKEMAFKLDREKGGEMVRVVWVEKAQELPNPKPSNLLPWSALDDWNKEVDRCIAERLTATTLSPLLTEISDLAAGPLMDNDERRFGDALVAIKGIVDEAMGQLRGIKEIEVEQ